MTKTISLPNFEKENIHDWIVCDRFRFEKEDVARVFTDSQFQNFTFYKIVFSEFSKTIEKVVVFDGDKRVGYITLSYELHGLYVMPPYRGRSVAKKLLSFVPPNLPMWVQGFRLRYSEPEVPPLNYGQLSLFYTKYYQ